MERRRRAAPAGDLFVTVTLIPWVVQRERHRPAPVYARLVDKRDYPSFICQCFIVVVATTALCLVLRARALRSRVHATTMVCGAALSLFAIPAHFGFAADPAATVTGLWAAAAVVGVALAAMLAGAVVPSHIFSEPIREAVEYLEYVGYALIVPFVAWALGLLHYVRYH
jgi:hypothetical protein